MNQMPTNQGEEHAAWLELARRQSHKLAETRAQHVPALGDWARRGAGGTRPWRLSWALALLPLLILGGATGTWAFVAHLKARSEVPVTSSKPRVEPVGAEARPAAAVRRPVVQPRVATPPEPAPRPLKRKVRPSKQPPSAPAQPEVAGPGVPDHKPQQVIFGSSSEPVIIVNPPARLGPLWTPEDYKKSGGPMGRGAR